MSKSGRVREENQVLEYLFHDQLAVLVEYVAESTEIT